MQNRPIINSGSLQARFPKIYQRLFTQCPIVVSSTRHFFWTGEHVVMYGGLSILQSVPIRTYIGLEPISKKGIEFATFITYSPDDERFISWDKSQLEQSEIINTLLEIFPEISDIGLKIHTLTEIPPSHGFGERGCFTSALVVAIKLYLGQIKNSKIKLWQRSSVSELVKDKNFNETFRQSWKLEIAHSLYNASGAHSFPSLVKATTPVVYFKYPKVKKSFPRVLSDYSISYPDYFNYHGFRLTEITKQKSFLWPFDFGIIYSGIQKLTGAVVKSTGDLKEYLDTEVKDCYENFLIDYCNMDKNLIYPENKKFFDHYVKFLSVVALENLSSFCDVFEKGTSSDILEKFSRSINLYQNGLYALDVIPEELDNLLKLFAAELKKEDISHYGIKTTGSGGGGAILFIAPFGLLRNKISKILEKLKTETGLDLTLDYASWIDGIEEGGIKIEQELTSGIYSNFISEGSLLMVYWDEDAYQHEFTLSLEEFQKKKEDIDLLLDQTNGEIYVRGKKLTSKELHSSIATISILAKLLDNSGKDVSNNLLPSSSYTRDRNELQSKIITPLIKIIKHRTKKTLDLKIQGGLLNFRVKMQLGDLKIYLLKKIM